MKIKISLIAYLGVFLLFSIGFLICPNVWALTLDWDGDYQYRTEPPISQDSVNSYFDRIFCPECSAIDLYGFETGNPSGSELGTFANSYGFTQTYIVEEGGLDWDFTGGTINFSSGLSIDPNMYECLYISAKDGNAADPKAVAWDLSDWNGTEQIVLTNLFLEGGSLSNARIRGCTVAPVPEPATMLLLGTGLACLGSIGRKKFFKKKNN